jgi:hypothetical protein
MVLSSKTRSAKSSIARRNLSSFANSPILLKATFQVGKSSSSPENSETAFSKSRRFIKEFSFSAEKNTPLFPSENFERTAVFPLLWLP